MHPIHRIAAVSGLLLLAAAAPEDPGAAVVAQRGDVAMTAGDIRTLLARATPAAREQLQKNPTMLAELVRRRVLQRALMQEAQAKKWDQRPEIAYQANLAHDQVIIDSYLASVSAPDEAYPSDDEVQAAYEVNKQRLLVPRQFHIAQIFLAVPAGAAPSAAEEARHRLADLRQQASRPKADFADLASRNSNDAASARTGGDLGWIAEDQLAPPIRTAVAGLPEGGLSDLVQMPDGWHLLRLVATKPAAVPPLADIRETLVRALRQQRAEQLGRDYVAAMQRNQPVQLDEIVLSRLLAR